MCDAQFKYNEVDRDDIWEIRKDELILRIVIHNYCQAYMEINGIQYEAYGPTRAIDKLKRKRYVKEIALVNELGVVEKYAEGKLRATEDQMLYKLKDKIDGFVNRPYWLNLTKKFEVEKLKVNK
ncbi:hypothetical protein ACFL1H_04940 [Nanoarchaeota archaeon]